MTEHTTNQTPMKSNKDKKEKGGINSEDHTTTAQQTMRLGALAGLTDSTVGQGHITTVPASTPLSQGGKKSCISVSICFICNKAIQGG